MPQSPKAPLPFTARTLAALFITGCVLIHIAALLALADSHPFPLPGIENDGVSYLLRSKGDLLQRHPFHGPGYPLAIRLLRPFTENAFAAAKVISLASSTVLIVLAAALAWRMSPLTAALAAGMLSLHPWLLKAGSVILSDALAAALLLAALTLFSSDHAKEGWGDRGIGRSLALGVFGGLLLAAAMLTRSIYLVSIAGLIPLALAGTPPQRQGAAAAAITVLLALATWATYSTGAGTNPITGDNHLNVVFHINGAAQGWSAFPTAEEYPDLLTVLRSNPSGLLHTWLNGLADLPGHLLNALFPWAWLAPVGLMHRRAASSEGIPAPTRWTLAIVVVAYGAAVSLVWFEARFALLLVVLVAVYSAQGAVTIARLGAEVIPTLRSHIPPLLLGMSVLGIASHGVQSQQALPPLFADPPAEYQASAAWLREHANSEARILAAVPHIPYEANMIFIDFREVGLHAQVTIHQALQDARATFLIWDNRSAATQYTHLASTLNYPLEAKAAGLELVYSTLTPQALRIYAYTPPLEK